VAKNKASYTGTFLAAVLANNRKSKQKK